MLGAYCACPGGRDGGCKRVAVAIYSFNALLNTEAEDSVTSTPFKWTRIQKSNTSPCEVKDLPKNIRGLKDQDELLSKKKKTHSPNSLVMIHVLWRTGCGALWLRTTCHSGRTYAEREEKMSYFDNFVPPKVALMF